MRAWTVALVVGGATAALVTVPNCTVLFQPPTPVFGDHFGGCFSRHEPQRLVLLLEQQLPDAPNKLTGSFDIGDGTLIYALNGLAKSETLAVLDGTRIDFPAQIDEITVLRAVDDTLAVRVNDDPPLGPLQACM